MLIEFTVGNYRSFRAPQTLSMIAAPLKSKNASLDKQTVIDIGGSPSLLTSSVIYGANASGKSNLVSAISFMRSFVLDSPKETKAYGGIAAEPFRLKTNSINEPAHFEIVLIEAGKRYRYGFEATRERVTAEWLYYVPSTREAKLFEREGDHIVVGSHFKEGKDLKDHTRPNALFLSVVAQFNGPIAQRMVKWFRSKLSIISGLQDYGMRVYTQEQLRDGHYAEAIRRLICRLDLGISDVRVEKASLQLSLFRESQPYSIQQANEDLFGDDAEQMRVKTIHTRYDENDAPSGQELFDLDEQESEGTQKLFAMSGPLLNTLENGDVLVVDELDARLHPLMTREIISLFNNRETNPHGAQLIFNTQDTNLLDNTLFRRDQIWFIEKDQQGASHLYSLAEFRVRNDKDYERGYIQGRYGAVPYLGQIHTIVNEAHAQKALRS